MADHRESLCAIQSNGINVISLYRKSNRVGCRLVNSALVIRRPKCHRRILYSRSDVCGWICAFCVGSSGLWRRPSDELCMRDSDVGVEIHSFNELDALSLWQSHSKMC